MKVFDAEPLLELQSCLAESPIWYASQQKLFWVDVEKMELHSLDPIAHIRTVLPTYKRVGAVIPASEGKLLLALQGEIAEIILSTGIIEKRMDLESNIPNNRCNDGKCDRQGRLWIGTMNIDCNPHEGSLYCIDKKWNVTRVLQNLTISNGLVWSASGDKMYFIDSHDRNVKCFNVNYEMPYLTEEKIVLRSETDDEMPDGMCIDSEGMLWVAFWGGARIGRYNPDTGEKLAHVNVPALHVTSCCFGDKDLKTLYITSARNGLTEQQLRECHLSGSLFSCRPGVSGLLQDSFYK